MEYERGLGILEHLSSEELTLKNGVYFVSGASRGAIYDINTGRVYSINQIACEMLTGKIDNLDFWSRLGTLGLTMDVKAERKITLPELLQRPKLEFVWFELISDDCNQCCIHCYAESMPLSYRKALGLSFREPLPTEDSSDYSLREKKLTTDEWRIQIKNAYSLGCRHCQFIGGEPFLYKGESSETVIDLAEYARNLGYEFVEIYTNTTLLTRYKAERIKKLGINIAVSLYSINPDIHDEITKTPGSFWKTIHALDLLREAGVPTRVETVLMKLNETTAEETQKYIDEMGFSHHGPDVLRPKGRGDNPELTPAEETLVKYGLMTYPSFRAVKEILSRNLSGNSCLLGKIVITDSGKVLPCVFSRNYIVGNVKDNTLPEIVEGRALESVWGNTKDQVLVCHDCEYRYVCFDCRPLSEGASQGRGEYLSAPYPRCTYNPYTGEWARGVWRLDENGQPFYDETLKPVIMKVATIS